MARAAYKTDQPHAPQARMVTGKELHRKPTHKTEPGTQACTGQQRQAITTENNATDTQSQTKPAATVAMPMNVLTQHKWKPRHSECCTHANPPNTPAIAAPPPQTRYVSHPGSTRRAPWPSATVYSKPWCCHFASNFAADSTGFLPRSHDMGTPQSRRISPCERSQSCDSCCCKAVLNLVSMAVLVKGRPLLAHRTTQMDSSMSSRRYVQS
jgi:hypothetical protein